MKKKVNIVFVVILVIAGLSLLLYPFIANQWNNYRQKQLMSGYDQSINEKEETGGIDYATEKEKAEVYNEALLPSILPDSFAVAAATEEDDAYMACLNITENGMMGTIEIPGIDITLPIFHTTSEEVLEMAAGHLEGSSLPIGGENTHAVISAHRGLPSATLFTNLDKMGEGDHFLLHILDETLCYEVDKITVVEPEDTKDLQVEDGKDLVTLMTCTPYGVNSHRLLVRGHRVPYDPEVIADETNPFGNWSLHTNYLLWAVVGILVAVVFSLILYKREKRLLAKSNKKKTAKAASKKTAENVEEISGEPKEGYEDTETTDKDFSEEAENVTGKSEERSEDPGNIDVESSAGASQETEEAAAESKQSIEDAEAAGREPAGKSEKLAEEPETSEESKAAEELITPETSEEPKAAEEPEKPEMAEKPEERMEGEESELQNSDDRLQETGEEEQP